MPLRKHRRLLLLPRRNATGITQGYDRDIIMRRGKLIYRSQRQLRAARTMLARQPLVARLTKHQRLAQELGSPAFPTPIAPLPTRTSLLPAQTTNSPEQSFSPGQATGSPEQSFLPSPALLFLPPFSTQPEDE